MMVECVTRCEVWMIEIITSRILEGRGMGWVEWGGGWVEVGRWKGGQSNDTSLLNIIFLIYIQNVDWLPRCNHRVITL